MIKTSKVYITGALQVRPINNPHYVCQELKLEGCNVCLFYHENDALRFKRCPTCVFIGTLVCLEYIKLSTLVSTKFVHP